MSYSTIAHIQGEFKSVTFDANSTPNDTDVTRFIEEADAEIDSRVGLRYSTPVTGAISLVILRQISIGLVAQRVKDIVKAKSATSDTSQDVRDGNLAKDARKKLDMIVDGSMILSDATPLSAGQGVFSANVESCQQHTFKKGVDQW